jgi:hypothetical protein
MTPRAWIIAAVALALLIGGGLWRVSSLQRQLAVAKLAPAKVKTIEAAAKVETLTVQLAAAERVVTRTLTQVRTDTLMLHPQTAQDTATALVQLPALAVAHDSLQKACSAFVMTCSEFRAAAEKRFAADSIYRVELEQLQAPRCGWRCGAVLGAIGSLVIAHFTTGH